MKNLLPLATALLLSACASAPATQTGDTVDIYKSDGSRQCEPESGQSPAQMQAKQLAGIRASNARKDVMRDTMFPAVCGGMTGSVNVYTIPVADLEKARSRGFERWQPKR